MLTLRPWALDWDNPRERTVNKKAQRPILNKSNVEGSNWKKKPKKKDESQPVLTLKTLDPNHESETNPIEGKS